MNQQPNIHLTPREQQVMSLLLSRGSSNKQIGQSLGISESTVKIHMSSLLKKYCAQTRTQLMLFATLYSKTLEKGTK